ncbi:hypothetical protein M4I32_13180 [Microbacterium sp. LRZ72]|uniref:hypothetical protein n=1 Tax=Microbacterium sp. LRZ72 TaxID=2942481 RepID=UPI0029AA6D52|nr:hypothetical protein [Microbacterium sp. LRZ72]MDX2377754.1 hypothetical protein [Microbacterium sp. LRZ72]
MAKIDLAGALGDARARLAAELRQSASAGPAVEATSVEPASTVPAYARLTRKEARIREDQDANLTALARRLMRRRTVRTERITENTLVRVAIDLLLAHQGALSGNTETEIRNSVLPHAALPDSATVAAPDSVTPDFPDSGSEG